MSPDPEPDLIVTKRDTPWILTELQVQQARTGAKFWRTSIVIGKRATVCRSCGESVPAGQRLRFRHLNLARRQYDLQGDLHTDLVRCAELKIEHEFLQWEASRVAAHLADPSAEGRFWEELKEIGRSI